MVARSDGANYGKLAVFQFPKQTVIFGPRQVAARINQDQVISPQITLWNQQGSEVIQGTLLVIPIEESLIYIRPLYLRAAGGQIPELKRVIVAYQNNIVMEETLDAALERILPAAGRCRARPRAAPRHPSRAVERAPQAAPDVAVARGAGASPLRACAPGAARRELGALRRGDQETGRGAGADAEGDAALTSIQRRIDSGSATAMTVPRAVTTPAALTSTCTVTLRPAISVALATSSSSGPWGVGFRKSTCSDAVT